MAGHSWRLRPSTTRIMAGLWLAYTGAYFGFFYAFQDLQEIADASLDGYLEVILLGVPVVVLLGAVMWLDESDLEEEIQFRIVAWTMGLASVFLVAMYAALFVIEPTFDSGEQWLILLLSLGFGASAGTVTGILSIRSKQRKLERDRSQQLAKQKERQRSQLEHLNQYLRHEVLNEANKIEGYAALLIERIDTDEANVDYLEVIRQSGTEIAEFIESIRKILTTTDHEPELGTVDIISVIETEATRIEREYQAVTVEIVGPESVAVLAGELINRVFRNLIENAVEHNSGTVSITIDVEHDEKWVAVRIRDDGSGIPVEYRDGLFEPPESADHGYGLFLMRNLVEVYGGRLNLADTGPQGTEFVIKLLADTTPEITSSVQISNEQLTH
ncbi:MAG: sensor histidine kinase [Halobacteriales archaeon]